jgi:thymidylate synthase
MVPGELIFSGGDVHVYKNQIDGLSEQCRRDPYRYSLPTLELNPEIKEISQFTYDDIKIKGYHSYPTIKLPLSVG